MVVVQPDQFPKVWGSHTSGCAAKTTALVVEDDTRRRFSLSVRPLPRKCRPALTMAHSINGGDENAAGFSSGLGERN
jgi:hypothetical protein